MPDVFDYEESPAALTRRWSAPLWRRWLVAQPLMLLALCAGLAQALAQAAAQTLAQTLAQTAAQALPQAPAQPLGPALWWPGFIDAKGKVFLELPADARLCALARDTLRRAKLEPGRVAVLPLKVESFLPRDARLTFGVTDAEGAASARVLTRVIAIDRVAEKGACAHLAEAGADAPGYVVEEDRLAFGVHPPRPLSFRAAKAEWKNYGSSGISSSGASIDARFAATADTPPGWRARVAPWLPGASDIFGQSFEAVLEARRPAQPLALVGGFVEEGGGATYNTLNLIVRDSVGAGDAGLFQAGPSGGIERDRTGSYVAQVVGVIDLDGDGVDELVLRARYFSGGNLKVLKLVNGKFIVARDTAYEGE